MKYINVVFTQGQSSIYTYVCRFNNIKVGDVVVDTPNRGLALAAVVEVGDDVNSLNPTRKYKVNVQGYKEFMALKAKEAELAKQIERMVEEYARQQALKDIAKKIPAAKGLLAELKAIQEQIYTENNNEHA